MDIMSIPQVNSIVLTGLDFSMKPQHAQYESKHGYIQPFHELKVMHLIKSLAVMVYNQEKMTPYLHNNVCDGRNTLAYFICAMHRQQAPQGKTKRHSRQDSASSYDSNSSPSSISSWALQNSSENGELPKLCTTSMLPLGYWDSLYYALVAEIRQLHHDLTTRFGFRGETANQVLHQQGPDGTTDQPITAIDLASMLETAWYALMDSRLVATLDDAVRMRNLRENAAQAEVDDAVKLFLQDIADSKPKGAKPEDEETSLWPPPIVEGMIDVNALSAEAIVSLLWEKHAPQINRACLEDFEDEAMLTAYRAELHAKEVEAAVRAGTPLSTASFCTCSRTCVCSLKCDKDSSQCTCMNGRAQVYHLIRHQEDLKHEIHTKHTKSGVNIPNHFLGAATNTLAQMQIAAMANPHPVIIRACNNIHDANTAQLEEAARPRIYRNNSDLAYVPVSTTTKRTPKDAYPLGLYGNTSPQRYPKMASQTTDMPKRKPVLPRITTSVNPYGWVEAPTARKRASTPPPTAVHNDLAYSQASHVTYPYIPASQSERLFSQGFSSSNSDSPGAAPYQDVSNSRSFRGSNIDPAQEYVGLLSRHPSTIENDEQITEPFPRLSYPSMLVQPKKAATTNDLPTLTTFNAVKPPPPVPPLPPALPQPEFIAPRPALKQRYVSAGGNAKLSDRAEIQGPAYTTPMASTGAAISREEVESKMSDPEWVKKHFGEAALGVTSTSTPPRASAESSKRGSRRISERKSNESDRSKNVDKRDRTSSGASGRVAKLNRVFSRKNSTSEEE